MFTQKVLFLYISGPLPNMGMNDNLRNLDSLVNTCTTFEDPPAAQPTFDTTDPLGQEIAVDTGEVRCPICSKMFRGPNNMRIHYRLHTGRKPYQCHVCNKTFNHRPHLVSHQRTHTGEKPFRCQVCYKGFARKDGLKQHARRSCHRT